MEMSFYESDQFCREWHEKLQAVLDEMDKYPMTIRYINMKFFNIYPRIRENAVTDERKAFLKECEQEMVVRYQRSLENNYKEIKDHKDRGIVDRSDMETWILTLDKEGNPAKTTVIGIDEKGYPIYADGCTAVEIYNECMHVGNSRYELNRWLESNSDLYELRTAAKELKEKGRLGIASIPTPNYDLDGMGVGQRDAAAWQNYAIENGMYRPTDYDRSLDILLESLDACIDFYEKAISMV